MDFRRECENVLNKVSLSSIQLSNTLVLLVVVKVCKGLVISELNFKIMIFN